MNPLPASAPAEFGDRLRIAIGNAGFTSNSEAASAIEMSPQQLSNLLSRSEPPSEKVVHRLSESLGVPPSWLRYGVIPTGDAVGGSGDIEESPEDAVATEWPDVSQLKPKALAFYHQTIGEFTSRGWTPETTAAAARALTAFLRGESTLASEGAGRPDLSDEEQLIALQAVRRAVETVYGRGGRGSSS